MPIPAFAYKVLPLALKLASLKFRRSPQIMALIWLLPLLKTPAAQRRRAARMHLAEMLLSRTLGRLRR